MRKNKLLFLFISIILILNSCGFQLRKPIELDYKSYSIVGDESKISAILDKQLSFSNVKKTSEINADLVIEILNNNFEKRILSLAGNGQVGEFELVQTIEYRFNVQGNWSLPRKLESIREYTYDPTLYNAAAAEERYLRKSMEEQISRSLITEINNLGK